MRKNAQNWNKDLIVDDVYCMIFTRINVGVYWRQLQDIYSRGKRIL